MKFDKILQYQKIDQELLALETEVAKSEVRQKFALAKSKLDGATATIGKLKTEANDLLNGYTAMKERIDALKAEIDEFDGILDDVQDVGEAEHYLKLVTAISEKIVALEKEANAASSRIDQVNDAYKKTWEQGVKASEAYNAARTEYNAFVGERQPRVTEIKKQLDALKPDIPEQIMKTYMSLRATKKMPAFVEYDPNKKICGRCYMEVPNDTCAKLRNAGDFAECPNCRGILFVSED